MRVGKSKCKVVVVVAMLVVVVVAAVTVTTLMSTWSRDRRRLGSSNDVCKEDAQARRTDTSWLSWLLERINRKEDWWQILCQMEQDMRRIQYSCHNKRLMGNKNVCFDFDLVPRNNCTVYSFGINYNFNFDDAMGKYGCKVFSFDPSMKATDHQRSDNVTFKRLGIFGKDMDDFRPRMDKYVTSATTWRVRRLSTVMRELGHSEGSLTVLKMDIESTEWVVMKNLLSEDTLLASIPQVLIEWHLFKDAPPRSLYADLKDDYFRFKARGFHNFHANSEGQNHKSLDALFSQTESSWVNERFLVKRESRRSG